MSYTKESVNEMRRSYKENNVDLPFSEEPKEKAKQMVDDAVSTVKNGLLYSNGNMLNFKRSDVFYLAKQIALNNVRIVMYQSNTPNLGYWMLVKAEIDNINR
jgi:uncharacterized protein (DUF39 family)